jgi:pimeloyl-ACP methyl ester carboxylesterase
MAESPLASNSGIRTKAMTSPQLQFVEVNGQTIAYRQAGQGPALVLLHGFLCDSRCWRQQLAGLSDQFRVVAWDAPGAGSSSDPPDTFTTASYAQCLAGFLDAIGIERAHVLGLSWGGILAQEFYRLHANRFRSLVLADTYAGWRGSLPEADWKDRLATCLRMADGPPEAVVVKLLPGMFTDAVPRDISEELSAIISEFHPIGFRLMSLSSAEVDTRDLLPRIDAATLVLWGDDDRRSPMHIAQQLHASIPNAELAVIPNAGHVSNMQQPDAFNDHVRRFCLSAHVA